MFNIMSIVERPWGSYESIYTIEGKTQVKRITVKPKCRLSLQSHYKRSEHWVVVQGIGKVQVGKDFLTLHENQHVYIPKETLHRIENLKDDEDLAFIETQVGSYLGEDDIVRYEDDFGRV